MKPPAFQFYADDFLAGVADMTQAEVGAYILLLCSQWSRGEIPQDQARCAMIAKGEVSAFVFGKFPNGRNARLEKVRREQDEYRNAQSSNGKAGALKRWNGIAMAPLSHRNSNPNGETMAKNSSPTPSPTPSPTLTPIPTNTLGAPAAPFAPTVKHKPKKPARTDAEIVATYTNDAAYRGIDVAAQLSKMRNWCAVNGKEPTERRFVNWLNRCDQPLTVKAGTPDRIKTALNYEEGM
jgi:uncharacterized protein YdaU (DUF1376 family)